MATMCVFLIKVGTPLLPSKSLEVPLIYNHYIYIYILCNNCMLRPLRKANAETRRVFNKALKTEAHSPLCKLYIYIGSLQVDFRVEQYSIR